MSIKAHPSRSVAKEDIWGFGGALAKQGLVGGADTLTGTSLSVNVASQASQMRMV